MRILNPKKSSGSNGISVSESGDLSFDKAKKLRSSKFAKLKASIDEMSFSQSEGKQKEVKRGVNSIRFKENRTSKQQNRSGKRFNQNELSKTALSTDASSEDLTKKEYNYLYQKGIHLLSMREHSVKEVTTKLSAKSERLDLVSAVVDELIDKDYLSNSRFTESYVRAKQQRGFGPTKIRNELSNKDIKNSMIDNYLNASSAVWYENAQNQYTKKYGDEPISDYNSWTKRARFMQSRGFTMEHIHSTLPPVESD